MDGNQTVIDILPPWDESIAALANGVKVQLATNRFDRGNYSTTRWILSDSTYRLANKCPTLSGSHASIEFLPVPISQEFSKANGLQFLSKNDAEEFRAFAVLESAIAFANSIRWVRNSLDAFVWIIHILRADGEDCDVSHSDPDIPFSIFVSVPRGPAPKNHLRVAESILHESMHLQLSLFEIVCPLVVDSNSATTSYSPWKGEDRPTRGVLHGLYVFKIVKTFWQETVSSFESSLVQDFAKGRIRQIQHEISQVRGFQSDKNLTEYGRELARQLLR